MIIKNKKINRKWLLIIAVILVCLAAAAYTFYYFSTDSNRKETDHVDKTSSVKQEQVQEDNSGTDEDSGPDLPSKNPSDSEDPKPNTPTPSYAPEQPNISRAGQTSGSIKVVATLQKSSAGYCELQLSKSGQQTVKRKTSVTVGPSYYVCSFNLPTDTLASKGSWNVTVIHHIGEASTKSNTQTIEA